MNEHKKFIKNPIKKQIKYEQIVKKKEINSKHFNQLFFFRVLIIIIFLLMFILLSFCLFNLKSKKQKKTEYNNITNNTNKYAKYDKDFNNNSTCDILDPINIFNIRIKNGPFIICNETNTKHICYKNPKGYFNDYFALKDGIFCIMENIVIDPSKSTQSGLVYTGPIDRKNFGFPILSKGFLNTKCTSNNNIEGYNQFYNFYFNSWNYDYNIENEKEELEELAPGKTVFLVSRNQESNNLFHGHCDIINIISMLYIYNLSPEDIQIILMESMDFPQDPFYDTYKTVLSLGGEPIYLKNLKKKYKISKAIHVPINFDSPTFTFQNLNVSKCDSMTRTYQIYNDFVDKYMDIKPFIDTFISDNITSYYPDLVIKNHEKNIKFTKTVTIQWRRIWPEGRQWRQSRILNNGPQLADKLASALPNNILVRLINTAALSYKDQISLTRNTDYLVGVHGAGLSLNIFLPKNSIFHEIVKKKNIPVFTVMSSLSQHVTYFDELKAESKNEDGKEFLTFNEDAFVESVLAHMKENNFFS